MNKIRSLLATAYCILLGHAGFCNPGDSVLIKLTVKHTEIKKAEDLKISLKIESHRRQTLFLPATDLWGLPSGGDAFYIIQIQKKSGGYVNLPIRGALDNVPNFNNDRLHFGDVKELAFPLYILYEFTKGEYRIRVLCKLSKINKISIKLYNVQFAI